MASSEIDYFCNLIKSYPMRSGTDCSEVAEHLWRASNGAGNIVTFSRVPDFSCNGEISRVDLLSSPIKIPYCNDFEEMYYHTIFVLNNVVYCIYLPYNYMSSNQYLNYFQEINKPFNIFIFTEV
jgi:hypothetical protein